MKESLMVRGKKFWIADRESKVLVGFYDTKEEAKDALRILESHEREEGYYIPYFYRIVEGVLGALRMQGYTALDDCRTLAEM